MKIEEHHVLVCPLDWGLGHASRMIPVINALLESGNQVSIGGSGKSCELLKTVFPQLPVIFIPSAKISIPRSPWIFVLFFMIRLPHLLFSIFSEHHRIQKIVKFSGISMIISDNRYGLYSKYTTNILVTHQLSPVLPLLLRWAEYPVYRLIKRLAENFTECWIPDEAGEQNYSGILSHRYKLPKNAKYIGILSRFSAMRSEKPSMVKFDASVILSGPQPQLGFFTRKIIEQAEKLTDKKILIISGLQEISTDNRFPHLKIVSHLNAKDFRNNILNSKVVICRSGYSTIMDLVALNCGAVLVPTPGQSEQKYLAEYLCGKGLFKSVKQSEFCLKSMLDRLPG